MTEFYILEPPEIVPFSFGTAPINQGETAAIMCNIKRGDLPVSITWSLKGEVVASDPDMTTSMIGSQISLLNIKHVDYQHSGVFTCRATNSAGSVTHSAQLKVNGNLTGEAVEIFYLQRSRILSPSPSGRRWSTRESLPS